MRRAPDLVIPLTATLAAMPCISSFPTLRFIRDTPESLTATLAAMPCISSFPTLRLSGEKAVCKNGIMKFTKNIGMLLLAVYLIIDALLGFGLHLGPAIFLLYLVGLVAGVFILIGK